MVARHAIDLIGELLVYATVDHDENTAEPVDLNDVVASVRASLAETFTKSAASIESADLPTIRGNRIRLRAPASEPHRERDQVSR